MSTMGKRRDLFRIVILMVFVLTMVSPSFSATASPSDAGVMQNFAKSITSPLPSGWSTTSDPCSGKPAKWAGVSCDSSGRVTFVNLRSQSLAGTLPSDINQLGNLQSLSLQANAFSGALPSFENLANLQEIYLNDNNFTSIPLTFFSGLTSLVNVSLDHNQFEKWAIPEDLSGSANLVSFSAMNAGVSGPIPDFFGKMVSLQMLRLSYNYLVGGIPDSFVGSGIRELDLNNQNTKLSGRLDVLGSMTQLTTVMLQSNNFSGPIPDLSNCTSLRTLLLRDNRLTGVVPASLSSLKLTSLMLANNLLQGPFPGIDPGIWTDSTDSGNSFCNSKPGPCDPRVDQLIRVAGGFGYPIVLANFWVGNDPCNRWSFVTCDEGGNVTTLNFGNQKLGGVISPAFAEIKLLKTLILSNNGLTGTIPDGLTTLPVLQLLDVSGNNLTGKIPAFPQTVTFKYANNPLLGKDSGGVGVGGSSPTENPDGTPGTSVKSRHMPMVWIIIVVAAIVVVVGLVFLFFYRRRKQLLEIKKIPLQNPNNGKPSMQNSSVTASAPSQLGYQETGTSNGAATGGNAHVIEVESMFMSIQALRQATGNFSEANILGSGGFGVVYKGLQPDGTLIAVKRMECGEMGKKGVSEFEAEIAVLTKVRHRHLVALLGYCMEGSERLLVYEYMSQGTLGQHLFKGNGREEYTSLNWKQRLTIALDVARGLEYLHSLAQKSFIHRDLKPSNILLDDDMRAKVSDFGLVKLAPDGKHSVETRLAGTFGYLAPEYATTGRVTTKVDVYAFGVVLMEMITGRKTLDETLSEETIQLVTWFRRTLVNKDNIRRVIDPTLDLDEEDLRSASVLAELACHCTSREAHQRPDMGHAVNVLSPLLAQWKPSTSNNDDSFTSLSFNRTLSQRLRGWQENTSTSMIGFDLDAQTRRMENTQGSITQKTDMFPQGR